MNSATLIRKSKKISRNDASEKKNIKVYCIETVAVKLLYIL